MANKTWVQLAQALRREAGVQGDGPSAVTGQTGIYENLVHWVSQAWVEIQSMHDNWRFMHATDSFPCVTATQEYTLDPVPKRVEPHSVVATNSAGIKHQVEMIDWSLYQEKYRDYTKSDSDQQPSVCTITPTGTMLFPDDTDDDYTISYEYIARPTAFSVSGSQPTLPEEYDEVIVFKALQDYGLFYNAPEAVQHGQIRYAELLSRLKEDQLIRPTVRLGAFIDGRNRSVSRFL